MPAPPSTPVPPITELTNSVVGDMNWKDERTILNSKKYGHLAANIVNEEGDLVLKAGSKLDISGTMMSIDSDTTIATNIPITTDLPDIYSYQAIAYGNGAYVCASANKNMYRSTDTGLTWTLVKTTTAYVSDIIFGNNLFIAITSVNSSNGNSEVWSSPDGITWTLRKTYTNWRYLNAIAWSGSIFAICAYQTTAGASEIMNSTNGTSWGTPYSLLNGSIGFKTIAYGNGRFVVTGRCRKIYYSTNGTSWGLASITNPTSSYFQSLGWASGNTFFLNADDGYSWRSTNGGVSWGSTIGRVPSVGFQRFQENINNMLFMFNTEDFLISTTDTYTFTPRDYGELTRIVDGAYDGTNYVFLDQYQKVITIYGGFSERDVLVSINEDGVYEDNSSTLPPYEGKKKGYYIDGTTKRAIAYYNGSLNILDKKMGEQE